MAIFKEFKERYKKPLVLHRAFNKKALAGQELQSFGHYISSYNVISPS
ncbi:hypothetical protein KIM67_12910 [Flagellimonas sp. 389]|nr:hypothetical protein [Flagellimonas sp. 389]